MRVWRACAGAAAPPTTTTKGISAAPESSWRRCLDDSHFTVPADRAAVVGLYGGYVSALGGKIAEADAATYLESSIDGKKAEIAGDRAKKVQFATVDDGASDAKMASMGKALGAAASAPTESASDDNPPKSPKSPTATPAAQPASPALAADDDNGGADGGDASDAAGGAEGGEAGSAPSPKSPAEPEGEYRGEFSSTGRKVRHNYPPIAH